MLTVLTLVVGAVLASCGGTEQLEANAIEDALETELPGSVDVDVDPDAETLTVTEDDSVFTTGVDLERPDWIPAAVTLPTGFEFDVYLDIDGIRSARGRFEADLGDLRDRYETDLVAAGWTIDGSSLTEPTFFQILATTPDGQHFDVEYVQGSLAFVLGRSRPETVE